MHYLWRFVYIVYILGKVASNLKSEFVVFMQSVQSLHESSCGDLKMLNLLQNTN